MDGLHFVIGGVLDGGTSELRRRVQSSNYGIGLRNAAAVETLRVMRTPAGLRKRTARGPRLSGQIGPGHPWCKRPRRTKASAAPPTAAMWTTAKTKSRRSPLWTLWLAEVLALHPSEKARWSDGVETDEGGGTAQMSERAQHMLRLLQGAMQVELHAMQNGKNRSNGNGRWLGHVPIHHAGRAQLAG
ncbi:MAG: hypothetical protein R2911_35715 [Caldilineaceae bacterium]